MEKLIRLGSTGDNVRHLQNLLKELGYGIDVDGICGSKTVEAIKSYQKSKKLKVDGIVGPATLSMLEKDKKSEEIINDDLKLKESDFIRASKNLGVSVAAIKAVLEVESGRLGGFLSNGDPVILFEGHIFWSRLKKKGINPEKYVKGNEDILYPKWTTSYYLGGDKEYNRLNKAIKIEPESALSSASWGLFQIMGFNYKACGYDNVFDYVEDMKKSEGKQLDAFVSFIKSNGWDKYLKNLDWDGFASKYNGPKYKDGKYDEKLKNAYKKYTV